MLFNNTKRHISHVVRHEEIRDKYSECEDLGPIFPFFALIRESCPLEILSWVEAVAEEQRRVPLLMVKTASGECVPNASASLLCHFPYRKCDLATDMWELCECLTEEQHQQIH